MTSVRVAVVEADPELEVGHPSWTSLATKLARVAPDLVVLNELPFGRWLAASDCFDQPAWQRSITIHDTCLAELGELGVPAIVGSRPAEREGRRVNEGFTWTPDGGVVGVHAKQHLPQSPGYWERTWTEPGRRSFEPTSLAGLKIGFMICTDIMFPEHARQYGRQGVDLIVCPRAMPPVAAPLFAAALSMAATVSGCYVASSNRGGTDSAGEPFEGRGCIINPAGVLVAQTNPLDDVVCVDIDTETVRWKQTVYPCDLPKQ
jgi:N-carbamoylputrescine amidase